VHAVESGKTLPERTLIAFGGAAPLHVTRVAEKLGITRILVPVNAGVGSAIGFLRAPISFEVARSRYVRLRQFAASSLNDLLSAMAAEARAVVERGARGQALTERRTAFARYVGQGYELALPVPARKLTEADGELLRREFESAYREQYGRVIEGVDVEVLGWTVAVTTAVPAPQRLSVVRRTRATPSGRRRLFDIATAKWHEAATYHRDALSPGSELAGPAIVVEDATATVIGPGYSAAVAADGTLEIRHDGNR